MITHGLIDKSVSQNGVYHANDDSADAYGVVTVNVQPTLGSISIDMNGTYRAADYDVHGFDTVTVDVHNETLASKSVTENGIYYPTDENAYGFNSFEVNVPPPTFSSVTLTENGTYYPSDYSVDAFSLVTVDYHTQYEKYIARTGTAFTDYGVTVIRDYGFYGYSTLQEVSFPACSIIGYAAFYDCSSLSNVYIPVAETIGVVAFRNTGIESVSFPAVKRVANGAFAHCSSLKTAYFNVCSYFEAGIFNGCTSLSELYLLSSSEVFVAGSDYSALLLNTPLLSGSGHIYVPENLLNTYRYDWDGVPESVFTAYEG